jgi:uroporphyrinogen-III synthase
MMALSRHAKPSLSGLRVVVTRPEAQAEGLLDLLRDAGAEAIHFPTIAIEALPMGPGSPLDSIADYDIVLVISRNAVDYATARLVSTDPWPRGPRIAAVGRATAAALARQGRPVDLLPQSDYSSEGLLALPQLQDVSGKRALIIRGEGGRELLAETLGARGATVDYAEVYRRVRPRIDPEPLRRRLADGTVDVVIATSKEGLENLFAMMGSPYEATLRATPLVVISEALMRGARAIGVTGDVIVAAEATDLGLLRATEAWSLTRRASERR